jgi:hypothetical protein
MKYLENIMETQKNYADMLDICSISYYANVNVIFEFFDVGSNCDISTLPVGCEFRYRKECGIGCWCLGLSHIPQVEVASKKVLKEYVLLVLSQTTVYLLHFETSLS